MDFAYVCRLSPEFVATLRRLILATNDQLSRVEVERLVELVLPRVMPNVEDAMVPVILARLGEHEFEYQLRPRADAMALPAYTRKWPSRLEDYFER